MTPTDPPGDQPDEGPITPEVVDGGGGRRRAADRKRRGFGGAGDVPVPDGPAPTASGAMFRTGCMVLIGLGVVSLFFAGPQALDAEGSRCTLARSSIEDANDNDDEWDDVALPEGVEEADDLDCDVAVGLAGDLPDDEDDSVCGQARDAVEEDGLPDGIDDGGDLPCDEALELAADIDGFEATPPSGDFVSEGTIRTFGLAIGIIALGQVVTGFFLLRTRARRARTFALVATGLGMLAGTGLGIIGLVVLVFIVYALVFSRDARILFPPGQGGGFLRPRPPRAEPT